ncbi:hypothetical protein [Candidatus Protochlamydia phocaeensis]|uniref:hypothetical protein n=1 Tax=Candidatus Protochlamydia phocaeensis TaxID=1414722 RepID=UPI000837D4CE|nr:hypothetical protein [Candidatus Protochlamydia phocaeensis]
MPHQLKTPLRSLREKASNQETSSSQADLKAGLTIEEMASHISQLKRPRTPFFRNPLNGNTLY